VLISNVRWDVGAHQTEPQLASNALLYVLVILGYHDLQPSTN